MKASLEKTSIGTKGRSVENNLACGVSTMGMLGVESKLKMQEKLGMGNEMEKVFHLGQKRHMPQGVDWLSTISTFQYLF